MWIEDYKKKFKCSSATTTVATDQITNSRPNTTLTPPSHVLPLGRVVMATSVAPVGNVSVPPGGYSVSDVFNQPPRHPPSLSTSAVVNARPPLLPYMQPGCFVHGAGGNQYTTSTRVYSHFTPLLAAPQSHKFPTYPIFLSPPRNVLLPRHPQPTFQQPPYPPYSIQVKQYPLPPHHLLYSMPQQGSLQHPNTSESL